jgi:hypothetical protein
MQDIQEVQQRIRQAFFEDLFLLLSQDRTREQTATEATIKDQEKLMQLGPVLHRLEDELLNVIIDRVFEIMFKKDAFPPLPQFLQEEADDAQDLDIQVEYISVLSQSQQANEINKVERFLVTLGNMAGLDPTVLDKWNGDGSVDLLSKALALDPELINTDEEAQQIRQQRQEQAQQQEQLAGAQQAAETAKTATEAGANLSESASESGPLGNILG